MFRQEKRTQSNKPSSRLQLHNLDPPLILWFCSISPHHSLREGKKRANLFAHYVVCTHSLSAVFSIGLSKTLYMRSETADYYLQYLVFPPLLMLRMLCGLTDCLNTLSSPWMFLHLLKTMETKRWKWNKTLAIVVKDTFCHTFVCFFFFKLLKGTFTLLQVRPCLLPHH